MVFNFFCKFNNWFSKYIILSLDVCNSILALFSLMFTLLISSKYWFFNFSLFISMLCSFCNNLEFSLSLLVFEIFNWLFKLNNSSSKLLILFWKFLNSLLAFSSFCLTSFKYCFLVSFVLDIFLSCCFNWLFKFINSFSNSLIVFWEFSNSALAFSSLIFASLISPKYWFFNCSLVLVFFEIFCSCCFNSDVSLSLFNSVLSNFLFNCNNCFSKLVIIIWEFSNFFWAFNSLSFAWLISPKYFFFILSSISPCIFFISSACKIDSFFLLFLKLSVDSFNNAIFLSLSCFVL